MAFTCQRLAFKGAIMKETNCGDVDYKKKFNEACNTIVSAYKSPENMKEILEQYLLNNACCTI